MNKLTKEQKRVAKKRRAENRAKRVVESHIKKSVLTTHVDMDAITEIMHIVGDFDYIAIKNKGFMPLHIERLSPSMISVAHYYDWNGDLAPDPEMIFELRDGFMQPTCYRYLNFTEVMRDKFTISKYCESAKSWNGRIRQQGFVEASKSKDNVTVGVL